MNVLGFLASILHEIGGILEDDFPILSFKKGKINENNLRKWHIYR
jgi:hypothetical protein